MNTGAYILIGILALFFLWMAVDWMLSSWEWP